MALAVLVGCLARTDRVAAAEETTILPNIYIGTINVGGMTRSEAEAAISSYVEDLSDMKVTLDSPNEDLTLTGKDIGLEADLTRSYDFLYQTDSNFYRYGVNYVPDDARTFPYNSNPIIVGK